MITLHSFQGSSTPHRYNSNLSSADSICLDESIEHVGRLAYAVEEFIILAVMPLLRRYIPECQSSKYTLCVHRVCDVESYRDQLFELVIAYGNKLNLQIELSTIAKAGVRIFESLVGPH